MRPVIASLLIQAVTALWVWGQPDRYDFLSQAPPPVPAANVTASAIGQRGLHTYYYWVVVNYTIGHSLPSGPAIISDAPDTLSAVNYVQVRWAAMPSATSYDVLRTTTGVRPQGACTCAVAIANVATSENDIGNALLSYTATSVGPASGWQRLNNRSYHTPLFELSHGILLPGGSWADDLHTVTSEYRNVGMKSVTAPGLATYTAGGPGVLNGLYLYGISYVTDLGETELGPWNWPGVNALNQVVNITNIPVSGEWPVIARRIYRSLAGMHVLRFVATINDNTTTTYTDNTADGALGLDMSWRENTTGGMIYYNGQPAIWTGVWNTALGLGALSSLLLPGSTGSNNTAIGRWALNLLMAGGQNVAVGENVLSSATNALENTGVGNNTLSWLTTGSDNTNIGYSTGFNITTGSDNVGVGAYSLGVSTGSNNTALGRSTLLANSTGSGNVALGHRAGRRDLGSNHLWVDNQDRLTAAGELTTAMLSGFFAATAAGQILNVNASLRGLSVAWQNSTEGGCTTHADLVVDALDNTKVTSALYNFVAADIGGRLQVLAGAGWTLGDYTIINAAGNAAFLDRSPAALGTINGTYTVNRGRVVLHEGVLGVAADTFRVCTADAAGALAWRALF